MFRNALGRMILTFDRPVCGAVGGQLTWLIQHRDAGYLAPLLRVSSYSSGSSVGRRRACLTRAAGIAIGNTAVERRSGRYRRASGPGRRRPGAGIAVFSVATGMWQAGGVRRSDRRCGGRSCRYGFVLGHCQLSPLQHADGRTTKSGRCTERQPCGRITTLMQPSSLSRKVL